MSKLTYSFFALLLVLALPAQAQQYWHRHSNTGSKK